MPNVIEIQVKGPGTAAGLAALRAEGQKTAKDLEKSLGDAYSKTEQKSRDSGNKMTSAMRGTVAGMTRELDKLERVAALSGEGMSDGYRKALDKVRADLNMVTDVAKKTGRGFDEGLSGSLRSVQRSIAELRPTVQQVDRAFDTAGKNAERELNRVEDAAHKAGRGMDKEFQTALKGLREDLSKARTEGARTGATLESELGGALANVRQEAEKLRESLKPKGGDDSGGGGLLGDLIGDIPTGKAGALAAGAAVGAALWSGLQAEWQEDRVGALISAQTGAARGSAERLGDIAGDVFADNFGESIEQVGESMTAVFQNRLIDTSAPEAAIERVTKKVLTLQATTGETANDISRSARQLLVTGLAGNMTAAMDMIQHATEKGLNTTDELLDTIEEYGTHFRALGLNGQEAFGLIDQAVEGGARNVDQAADALKEFQIRAQDMSATTRRGFETIGLNADVMGRKMAAGGNQAKEALRETLDHLRAMPEGVARNSAAVDLFGTKAEDLGKALYSMDLDTAADKFGDFGGSVEEASQKISDGVSRWDKVGKGFNTLINGIGEGIDKISGKGLAGQINEIFQQFELAKEQFMSTGDTTWLDEVKDKYPQLASSVDEFIEAKRDEVKANQESKSGYTELIETMDSYIGKMQEAAGVVLGLHDSQRAYQQAIDDVDAVVKEFGNTAKNTGEGLLKNRDGFDLAKESGREMQEQLDGLAESALKAADDMDANAASITDVNKHMLDARTRFINAATAMGISEKAAKRMADQLKLIPRRVSTAVEFRDAAARANIAAFKRAIDNIPRTVTVSTYVRGANISPSGGGGHHFVQESGGITGYRPMLAAATGGARNGPTVINEAGPELSELPNGTRVMTAGATEEAIRQGMVPWGQGGGGPVVLKVSWAGVENKAIRGILEGLRFEVSNSYGGDVQRAMGRR